MPKISKAMIYIDWGAAQRAANHSFKNRSRTPIDLLREALFSIDRKISEYLHKIEKGNGVRVTRRIYNGWHQGKTKTPTRLLFEELEAELRLEPARYHKVSFDSDIGWGNELLCGGARSVVWDTLGRAQSAEKNERQKEQRMVDMSLGVDLLVATRHRLADYHIVVCDDDDIWPAIVASLEWGASTKIIRITRSDENRHLDVKGIVL